MAKTFVEALEAYYDARKEHDEAKESADPYNWGYFGERWRTAVTEAEAGVQAAIDAAIDARLIARGLLIDRSDDV